MLARFSLAFLLLVGAAACGGPPSQLPSGQDWANYVVHRPGTSGAASNEWQPGVCAGTDLKPDYRPLDESNFVAFLRDQNYGVRVERQPVQPGKPDLVFVFIQVPGMAESIPVRVATLKTPEEAGRDLHEALIQRGGGYWGVHRSNVAVFGPVGSAEQDLAFAAKTKLACWGTFTYHNGSEIYVVPGGYTEP